MIRMRWLIPAAVLGLALPSVVSAQSPGAAETSLDNALAQSLTSAPIPGQTGIAISAGGNWMSGRTDTKGWSVDGIAAHTTQGRLLMRFEAEVSRTDYGLPTGGFVQVEDNHLATALVLKPLRPRLSAIGVAGWRKDAIMQLDYRAWVEGGVGIHVAEHPKLNILVAPMFAAGRERRAFTETGGKVLDVALLQSLSFRPHDRFSFDEFVSMHVDTTQSRDKYISVSLSALSKIVKYLSLKLYYQHQYAELVPPGQDPQQSVAGVQLQFTFQRTPAPAAKP
jgi:hypothetical protein